MEFNSDEIISNDDKIGIIKLLKILIADNFRFYMKSWNFHWNTTGLRFIMLHELFKTVYEAQPDIIDTLSERVRQLGGKAVGTLQQICQINGNVKEDDTSCDLDENAMLEQLASDVQSIIKITRIIINNVKDTNDFGTADMLTKILEDYEKTEWFLRSHIES